jgi:N-acetylmuramoyl-L-alanine amidase
MTDEERQREPSLALSTTMSGGVIGNAIGSVFGERSAMAETHIRDMIWDYQVLARTVYGEARGELLEGKVAVAFVFRNRALSRRWLGSVAACCLQPKQASCWNDNDPNRTVMGSSYLHNDPGFEECYGIAAAVLNGVGFTDPTGGAFYYLTTELIQRGKAPPWWARVTPTVRIGGHSFATYDFSSRDQENPPGWPEGPSKWTRDRAAWTERERYRDALQFYAHQWHWMPFRAGGPSRVLTAVAGDTEANGWAMAEEALKP